MATASNIDFRTSQSYVLGSGLFPVPPAPPLAAGTLNFSAARDLILGRLSIAVAAPNPSINNINGLVNVITVQGASILASNQPCAIRGFHTSLQMDENFIGVPLVQNGVAQVQYAGLNQLAFTSAAIYCDPWTNDLGEPPSPDESGPSALNYAFGLSQVVIGANATATINATALRACVLGRLYLEAFDPLAVAPASAYSLESSCIVTQVLINQTEQLGSQVNAGVPLEAFSLNALTSMSNLNQFVPMNGTVSVTVFNPTATPLTVHGHFFCNAS